MPPLPNGNASLNNRSNQTTQGSGTPKKASFLPLIAAVIFIIVSLVITFITKGKHSGLPIHLLGYLATPLAVGLCMGWDSIDQRKKTKADPWFIPKSKYSLILRILTALSFFTALPHISEIAKYLSQSLADLLHQS